MTTAAVTGLLAWMLAAVVVAWVIAAIEEMTGRGP